MKNRLVMALFFVCMGLFGCDNPDTRLDVTTPPDETSSRIIVTRIGVISDSLSHRGIYVITDTKTGKEYIGISGIGISETGRTLLGN